MCIVGNTNTTFKVFCRYILRIRMIFYSRFLSWQKCNDDDDDPVIDYNDDDSNCHILIIY